MFKFRRRSLCSSKEIFGPPRSPQIEEEANNQPKSKDRRSSTDPSTMTNGRWSFKANLKNNFIAQAISDRKRKDFMTHKRSLRSQSDDESATSAQGIKDLKRTVSNENFERKDVEEKIKTNKSEESNATAKCMRSFSSDGCNPELQRQQERFVDYNFPTYHSATSTPKKGHKRRHRSAKTSEQERESSPRRLESDEVEQEEQVSQDVDNLPQEADPIDADDELELDIVSGSSSINEEEGEDGEEVGSPSTESSESSETSTESDGVQLEKVGLAEVTEDSNEIETAKPKRSSMSFLESISAPVGSDHVMLSPRSTYLIKDAIDVPPSPPIKQIQMDPQSNRQAIYFDKSVTTAKLDSLGRQMMYFKKTLKELEVQYENMYGYKPSHADKLNNNEMKKYLLQLSKVKKEIKLLKDDPCMTKNGVPKAAISYPKRGTPEYLGSLKDTVKEIRSYIDEKRVKASRPEDPEKMTINQLSEEKGMMQRQLLVLEKRHGRPSSKEEKEIVRPLYDRYRAVKRIGFKLGTTKESSIDLVPIIEHQPLELPETNISILEVKKSPSYRDYRNWRQNSVDIVVDQEGDINITENESFNDMNLIELEKRHKRLKEEKRKLRSILKGFEFKFQEATGRLPLKDEKYSSSETEVAYQRYKHMRATIRLLDVLITKKKFPQLQLAEIGRNED